ncbi:MAG: phosphoenolpyruvate carboxykinase [Hyphomicrobiaceae bacterium]|nr:phosphoenolpyruvate carboxykinase [Hyphomicrobiaceae bacterium]
MTTEIFPISATASIKHNNSVAELVELAIRGREGRLAQTGAFVSETREHTGRSALDKFIVRDEATSQTVWWDNNKELSSHYFQAIYEDFLEYAREKDLFVQDLFAGADQTYQLKTRVICEKAWHALFIRHLLRRPKISELSGFSPEFTVVNFPGFRANPARHGCRSETVIACNFTKRLVLIGGTLYAGETKKSVFSFLNFIMPERHVMPMHCSANAGRSGDVAIFFGLSGTGKTTLSATSERTLLGDDEHGWSPNGVFNFEGGCYAKTIRLSEQAEPEIWDASNRFGTVLENVILDKDTRKPDFNDNKLTENTRSAYPLHYISNASTTGLMGHPKNIVMLCADAFGVLPPISKLSSNQSMYHFLSGYTAKVAGTEKGISNEPTATFSTCFGAPFMPRHPTVYGNMLRRLIAENNVDCWLVNTGWTGGKYGDGHRMPINVTRSLLAAAFSGELDESSMRTDSFFGFKVPVEVPGIDARILNPRETWQAPLAYDNQARALISMFNKNFEQFVDFVDREVLAAGPGLK